jgi:hypothetical protein
MIPALLDCTYLFFFIQQETQQETQREREASGKEFNFEAFY